jgi:predicted phosphodiesterase
MAALLKFSDCGNIDLKTLIISDTHLTDKFDKNKFDLLIKIINSADQVVINGDFWDSWFTSFDRFIKSKWSELFPLLLTKKAIYIYGNHDLEGETDKRTKLFSVKAKSKYVLKSGDQTFIIEHGDNILKDAMPELLKVYFNMLRNTKNTFIGKVIRSILHAFEWLGFNILGSDHMTNTAVSINNNKLLKVYKRNSNNWLICGDTHCPELDRKFRFANSGSINYKHATYLVINDGKVDLYRDRY